MLCTFGNPTFLNGVSQLPYQGYVANRTIKTMLETVALQKKTFTKFTITFQTPKLIGLPSFLPLSSNLLGIKPKWVKMPMCHETVKWIVLQSINEKQGVKCWVTKKNEGHLCSGRQQHNRDDLISMARLYMLHQFPCPLTRGSVGNWLYNKDFPFRSCVSMKMKQSSNPRWCRYTQQVC